MAISRKTQSGQHTEIAEKEANIVVDAKALDEIISAIAETMPSFQLAIKSEWNWKNSVLPKFDAKEYARTPKHQYDNIGPTSLTEASLGFLPSEIWLTIYALLNTQSILRLSTTCKILNVIANDGALREGLYKEQAYGKLTTQY